jgi:hypothetical protein
VHKSISIVLRQCLFVATELFPGIPCLCIGARGTALLILKLSHPMVSRCG